MLASQDSRGSPATSVLVSSGTLLAAIGRAAAVTGAALYYLVGSTLGVGALFLLVELVERGREPAPTCWPSRARPSAKRRGRSSEEEEVGIADPGHHGVARGSASLLRADARRAAAAVRLRRQVRAADRPALVRRRGAGATASPARMGDAVALLILSGLARSSRWPAPASRFLGVGDAGAARARRRDRADRRAAVLCAWR